MTCLCERFQARNKIRHDLMRLEESTPQMQDRTVGRNALAGVAKDRHVDARGNHPAAPFRWHDSRPGRAAAISDVLPVAIDNRVSSPHPYTTHHIATRKIELRTDLDITYLTFRCVNTYCKTSFAHRILQLLVLQMIHITSMV